MMTRTPQTWHDARRLQFSYVNGLFLGFATGAAGIVLELLRDGNFSPGIWGRRLVLVTSLLLCSSILFGLVCAYNRLLDFRETSAIAAERETLPKFVLAQKRRLNRRRGKMTWEALYIQIATFSLGSVALALTVVITYSTKIF